MWRQNHAYLLVDRVEDMTDPDEVARNKKCDRTVALYGFSRGANLNPTNQVHIPGIGDFTPASINHLPDPCPLPKELKKRSLNQKERIIYAPLTGQGGLLYDKDVVYLDIEKNENVEPREGDELMAAMANPLAVERNIGEETVTMVSGGEQIQRRPAVLPKVTEGDDESDAEVGSDDDEEGGEDDEEDEESEDEIEGPEMAASDSDNEGEDLEDAEEDGMTVKTNV